MVRVVLHAGDFHLDSAFGALTPEQARQRRMESRRTPERLVEWANDHGVQPAAGRATCLTRQPLRRHRAPVGTGTGVLPRTGGHRPRQPRPLHPESPYARTPLERQRSHLYRGPYADHYISGPELRRTRRGLHRIGVPTDSVLSGFRAPEDGLIHIGLLHGDVTASDSRYRPIRTADIAGSALDYLALGHVHSLWRRAPPGMCPLRLLRLHRGERLRRAGRQGLP